MIENWWRFRTVRFKMLSRNIWEKFENLSFKGSQPGKTWTRIIPVPLFEWLACLFLFCPSNGQSRPLKIQLRSVSWELNLARERLKQNKRGRNKYRNGGGGEVAESNYSILTRNAIRIKCRKMKQRIRNRRTVPI